MREENISYCALVNANTCESYQSFWGIAFQNTEIINFGNITAKELTKNEFEEAFGYNNKQLNISEQFELYKNTYQKTR